MYLPGTRILLLGSSAAEIYGLEDAICQMAPVAVSAVHDVDVANRMLFEFAPHVVIVMPLRSARMAEEFLDTAVHTDALCMCVRGVRPLELNGSAHRVVMLPSSVGPKGIVAALRRYGVIEGDMDL